MKRTRTERADYTRLWRVEKKGQQKKWKRRNRGRRSKRRNRRCRMTKRSRGKMVRED